MRKKRAFTLLTLLFLASTYLYLKERTPSLQKVQVTQNPALSPKLKSQENSLSITKPQRNPAQISSKASSLSHYFKNKAGKYSWSENLYAVLEGESIPDQVKIVEENIGFTVVYSEQELSSYPQVLRDNRRDMVGVFSGKLMMTANNINLEQFLDEHNLSWNKFHGAYIVNVENLQTAFQVRESAQKKYGKKVGVDLDVVFDRFIPQ